MGGWSLLERAPCWSGCYGPALVVCSETAVLLKQVGRFEEALDYATGALVNCQVRTRQASHRPGVW